MNTKYSILITVLFAAFTGHAQIFTSADSIRGSIGDLRKGWDVVHYDLSITINQRDSTLTGVNKIKFYKTSLASKQFEMQIDLNRHLQIIKAYLASEPNNLLATKKISQDAYVLSGFTNLRDTNTLVVEYGKKPQVAYRPPWDGGVVWKKDKRGRPWISVACQGDGASLWYPCKDHQSEEPEQGFKLTITCDKELTAVANGRLIASNSNENSSTFTWQVLNPINSYGVSFYIGHYQKITSQYKGINGDLDYTYWYLDYNKKKAQKLFEKIPLTLQAFEHWFGAFPWYNDGYQLVEAPYLGMEHQSAIAYGNNYKRGYKGFDNSLTGIGLKFDYILVHETGHEWFGNNITTADIGDMWIQEGFTTFSEALYIDYHFGKKECERYIRGQRRLISNREPIIAEHGINKEPHGDQYYKGSAVLLMIRTAVNDDEKFRALLKHLQTKFAKVPTTSAAIETEISAFTGINFQPLFDQYLYTNEIPKLAVTKSDNSATLTLTNCNRNFELPYLITVNGQSKVITLKAETPYLIDLSSGEVDYVNDNYYFD